MASTNTVVTLELSSANDGYGLAYNSSTGLWAPTENLPDFWRLIPSENYISTPATSGSITTNQDYSNIIRPGQPLRIFNYDGYIRGAGYYIIGSFSNVTGLSVSCVDISGRLYISIVDDGAGFRTASLYNNSSKAANTKIAHTSSYNATGNIAITADNGSGLGGTLTVLSTDISTDIIIDMYKWEIVSSINSTTISVIPATLVSGYASIIDIWYGSTNKIQQLQYTIPGNYAAAATTTLLADSGMYSRWQGADCRAAALSIIVDQISATPPTISFYSDGDDLLDGYGALAAAGVWFDFDVTNQLKISYLSNFEIGTTAGDATDDSDLTILISMILE